MAIPLLVVNIAPEAFAADYQGAYSASTRYQAGQIVKSAPEQFWSCLQVSTGNAPAEGSKYWAFLGNAEAVVTKAFVEEEREAAEAAGGEGGGGGLKVVNYVAAAEAMPGEVLGLLATPDELTIVLPADTLVVLYYSAMVSGPENPIPTLQLWVDGVGQLNENKETVTGAHSATEYGLIELGTGSGFVARLIPAAGEGGKAPEYPVGSGMTLWLAKGSHTVAIKYKGNVANKAKERRLIAVAS